MQFAIRRVTPPPSTERSFAPPNRSGAYYLAGAAGVAALLALALLVRGVLVGISFAGFLMLVVALLLLGASAWAAYWAWACATLRYGLRDGLLIVHVGLARDEVPVRLFERATRGRAATRPQVEGLDLPGLHIGSARVPRLGRVRVLSLHRAPEELLYLAGPEAAYAISVADTAAFVRAFKEEQGRTAPFDAPRVLRPPALEWLSLGDQLSTPILGASLGLALLTTAIIAARYAGFADVIQMNFPEDGRIGDRSAVLRLPLTAWALAAVNIPLAGWLSLRGRPAARTVLYGLVFLEATLVVAALTVV